MSKRIWVILGATSIIAEHYAQLAAQAGHDLRLVGRDHEQLKLISQDIQLRYSVVCEALVIDMQAPADMLFDALKPGDYELDLMIAHSDFTGNEQLNPERITQLIQVNILATTLLIQAYFQLTQSQYNLLYLSSVAACRGRAKNSLYGASKAAIEVYLEGLQQAAAKNQQISIVRLGYIDTRQTYGLPGIFYAASPQDCAKACWQAMSKHKRLTYYPGFWRGIMGIITRLPFFIYKKS